ncbi:alpha/beta fold hydrolase [Streptomyces sp. NBC_00385]|uniref:alpha/beta fold hydrolase n=1 Tax=Streptomyces sp. NBC_00385 TaxID=2975733 RepID=UPI002DDA1329|nr:alpha/beta hydrolase [Streptomyces sp. NBC_00385]WRZ04758.1 alpha/beta hydrolase [Streptomyces sp. NBC_00385]
MPIALVNGIRLHYDDTGGAGEPVVLVMGSGASGQAWHLHQVPALRAAGYRVITFDNRGIAPSDVCAEGFTIQDMVADLVGLLEVLGLSRCRLIGTSMGAYIVQELALLRPDLVQQAVLMATRGRTDVLRAALTRAEIELYDSGIEQPPLTHAVVQAMRNLSPRTLSNDVDIRDWLDIFELTSGVGPGERQQLALDPPPGRLVAYRSISVPVHVIAFQDDLVTPPELGREVAEAIPGASFETVAGCGHYGYLEDPESVNKGVMEFFRTVQP